MSKKVKLTDATEDIKRWAIDNAAPSALHSLIQKLHEEIQTMDETEDGEEDPGGNHPLKKPPIP